MIDEPQIVQTAAQQTAVVRLTIPRSEIQKVMAPAIGEVLAAVAAENLTPIGPVFSRHFRIDPQVFDFEVGVPVAEPFRASGRVKPSSLPPVRAARTIHRGPYEGLHASWEAFDDWIVANGHIPASHLWERYAKGPESSADPSNWETELVRPLDSPRPSA